ncbi:hypothetical protein GPL21_17365 [Bradyrhizobium pachyrhizi]|uniref:Large polyvalent protein associated domain-containing protein n=1 Tax=Bradyrhizobium pachyrhizi TaxID=280333 RepID=A0A844SVH3_9BRAD|nr:hypothetical protein [Bradyrhizobium pachyrhizi]MVT66871.1 hypothetical protein [Bradyrhizobium pachyrhizi]
MATDPSVDASSATTDSASVAARQQQPQQSFDEQLDSLSFDDQLDQLKFDEGDGQQAPDQDTAAVLAATGEVNPQLIQQMGENPLNQDIALGVAKAGIELKDVFGEPDAGNKWAFRQFIEDKAQGLRQQHVMNGVAQSITQFGVGFVGLGKVGAATGLAEKAKSAGRFLHWTYEAARGAAAGALFMDPHEERLSNLVEHYPGLSNPLSNYLAAKPDDSGLEGRAKNAVEGVVMDAALTGALVLVAKSIKLFRAGDIKGANEAAAEADAAFAKAPGEISASPPTGGLRGESEGIKLEGEQEAAGAGHGAGSQEDVGGVAGNSSVRSHDGSNVVIRDGAADGADAANPNGLHDGNVSAPVEVEGSAGSGGVGGTAEAGATGGGLREAAQRPDVGGRVEAGTGLAAEDASRALEQVKADTTALTTYGSRMDAIAAGYEFTPETSGLIPWQKLNTTENTKAWMDHLISEQSAHINTRRGGNAEGVLSDESVEAMVQQRAATWNESPADLMGALKAAGDGAPEMAANMETSFLIANKAYQDAYELASRISNDNLMGFGSREEALAALQHRMAMATTMYGNAKAIVSNAARTMRRMRGEFRITDDQLANITTADPEQLLKLVSETGGDPKLLAKASRITWAQRIIDPIAGMQAANLLWGWKTQVVNMATSSAMLVWRPLEAGIGSAILRGVGAVRGDAAMVAGANAVRQQSIREVTYLGSMLSDGWNAAKNAFIEGDSILVPKSTEHFTATTTDNLAELAQGFRPINSMDDLAANAVTSTMFGKAAVFGSLRVMGAADEMVKTVRYRAIVAAKASLEADQRGLTAGTREYRDYVSSRLEASVDDLGRGIDKDAIAEAQTSTFQQAFVSADNTWLQRRSIAQSYASIASDQAYLRILTPFIKTPANLFRYGIKLSPGVNLLQKEYLNAFTGAAGVEAQARAAGQMTLGIGLAGMAYSLWASGRLTGSGPQDQEQAKEWRKQGNRQFSIAWTDEKGERQFFELNPYDPVSMPLILVADAASLINSGQLREDDQHGLATSVVLALANRLKDKSYLKSVGDFIAAMNDDDKIASLARRTTPGLLPFSSFMPMVNPDPVVHEVRTVTDALMAKVPGWSSKLPPQRDLFGDVVLAPQGLTVSQRNAGPLADALGESFQYTGRYFDPPAPKKDGVDLREFTLKTGPAAGRTAYDRYLELSGRPGDGVPLKETLTDLVTSDGYRELPHGAAADDGTKESALMDVMKKYREAAWEQTLGESPELQEAVMQHKLDVAKAVASGAKNVPAVAGQARMGVIEQLLKPYGLEFPKVNVPSAPVQ